LIELIDSRVIGLTVVTAVRLAIDIPQNRLLSITQTSQRSSTQLEHHRLHEFTIPAAKLQHRQQPAIFRLELVSQRRRFRLSLLLRQLPQRIAVVCVAFRLISRQTCQAFRFPLRRPGRFPLLTFDLSFVAK
jgi:hypothetical protein